jgi:hypothetical protein
MPHNSSKQAQQSVNERLKFLIDALNLSARAFSAKIEVPDSNTRNYLSKGTKLNSDYLESIASHFSHVNLGWLITGQGEPFLPGTDANETLASYTKNNYGNNVGSNKGGTVTQHNIPDGTKSFVDPFGYQQSKIEKLESENQQLREQLQRADALAAAKDETIAILKSALARPN